MEVKPTLFFVVCFLFTIWYFSLSLKYFCGPLLNDLLITDRETKGILGMIPGWE